MYLLPGPSQALHLVGQTGRLPLSSCFNFLWVISAAKSKDNPFVYWFVD